MCDDLETGQITVELPSSVVALFPTANPNGILYTIQYWNTDLDIVYTSYNSGYFDINSGPIPGPQSGELTTANSGSNNPQQTSITGLFSGNYQIYINLYADGYIDGNGTAYPGIRGGMAPNSCAVSTQIPVPLKSCAPTVVQGCTDPNANYNPLATVDDGWTLHSATASNRMSLSDGTFDPTCCPPNQ